MPSYAPFVLIVNDKNRLAIQLLVRSGSLMRFLDRSPPYLSEQLFSTVRNFESAPRLEVAPLGRPLGHSRTEIVRWIHQVSAAYGLSPTYWAKTAGVAPSTLNKFLTGEQADKNLSAKTIEKLSSVLSALQPGRLMNASESREASFWADIPIIGDINDGNLVAACDVQITHSHTMQILFHSGYEKVPLFAFQVSKITSFPEVVQGEILICTPVCRLTGRQPLNGDRYILHDLIGHLVQASIREFTIDPTGKNWLVPLGYEAKHRSATYVNPEGPVSSLLDAGVMPPPREGEPGVKATFLIVGSVKPVIRLSGDRLRLTTAL